MINDAYTGKRVGNLSDESHFFIVTDKIYRTRDIRPNAKLLLGYIARTVLSYGRPFYKSNNKIAKDSNISPRTVRSILNKLVSQKYIRFKYDKHSNYRYISFINLKKMGLQGIYKGSKATINPYRSRNNYNKILRKPTNHKSKSFTHTYPASHHTYKSSPSHTNKLSSTQLNTLKSDAKLAVKLFPNYTIRSAMAGLLRKCIPDKHGHIKGSIPNISKALVVAKYLINKGRTVGKPVAYSCSISTSGDSLDRQYQKAYKVINKQMDNQLNKIKEDKIDDRLTKEHRVYVVKGNKAYVNFRTPNNKFIRVINKLDHNKTYPDSILHIINKKYTDATHASMFGNMSDENDTF